MLVTTQSPFLLNGIHDPSLIQVIWRAPDGFAHIQRVSDIQHIHDLARKALLGDLWVEGFFQYGDPLRDAPEPSGLPNPA